MSGDFSWMDVVRPSIRDGSTARIPHFLPLKS